MKRLVIVVAVVATQTLSTWMVAADAAPVLHVSAPVRVSGPVALPPGCASSSSYSPHAAVDPSDPRQMSVVYNAGFQTAGVLATTRDGGGSWSRTAMPGLTTCTGGHDGVIGDPFIAIGAGGRTVATESWVSWDPAIGLDYPYAKLLLNRSDDGGKTVEPAVEPDPGGTDQRGPVLFDPGSNNPLVAFERTHLVNGDGAPGFVYGTGGSLGVARFDEHTATWQTEPVPAAVSAPGTDLLTVALLRSGSTVVLVGVAAVDGDAWLAKTQAVTTVHEEVFSVSSTDNGATWSPPHPIGDYESPVGHRPGCCFPDAAVGSDGTLYVAWAHTDLGHGQWNGVDIASSTDHGASWSAVRTLRTEIGASGEIIEPAVAAGPAGSLGLLYYDETEGSDFVVPRLAVSTDAGATWATTTLGTAFHTETIADNTDDGTPMGPFQDLVATPTGFGATVTRGSGTTEDVWWYAVKTAS